MIVKIEEIGNVKEDDTGKEGKGLICIINGKRFSMLWKTFEKRAEIFLGMQPQAAIPAAIPMVS